MIILWVLGGAATGVLNSTWLAWAVSRLRPGGNTPLAKWVALSVWVRWGTAAAVLVAALSHGVPAALGAFAGLWLGRWPIIYAVHSGRLRFDAPEGS